MVTTWSWAAKPLQGPTPRPPLRLGARAARRGRHGHAPRGRRRLARRHGQRHARARPAGARRRSAIGRMHDIECFVPEGRHDATRAPPGDASAGPVTMLDTPDPPRLPVHGRPGPVALPEGHRRGHGSSASAARRATRSTCRRGGRARPTGCPPPTRSCWATPGSSPPTAW